MLHYMIRSGQHCTDHAKHSKTPTHFDNIHRADVKQLPPYATYDINDSVSQFTLKNGAWPPGHLLPKQHQFKKELHIWVGDLNL